MKQRYLVRADLRRVPTLASDVLVIGAGVAGLSAAIAASSEGASVTVLAKAGELDSNTACAQGGVAVALAPGDDPESHLGDTREAGAGLVDEAAARTVVTQGPARVEALLEWGAKFDRNAEGDGMAFAREAAHSRDRIIHAHGDATGDEVARALLDKVKGDPGTTLLADHFVTDLLHAGGRVYGALAVPARHGPVGSTMLSGRRGNGPHRDGGKLFQFRAKATVLAAGGAGRLYRETTNPEIATADGVAMGYRAGARLADMEFVQFHPTTLYVAGAPRLLVSEAVRGEGARLLNTRRERFMPGYHPDAELAPRDVVSASITQEMSRTESPHVYLDLRHLPAERVRARFPGIAETCAGYDIDLARDLIPVRPAAHYMMGGVVTDLEAQSSVEGLLACGEVACTGLHGANRLASNSLLEGLVFGRTAGLVAAASSEPGRFPLGRLPEHDGGGGGARRNVDLDDVRHSLVSMMTRSVGVFREGRELASAARSLGHWCEYVLPVRAAGARVCELKNMLVAATLVTRSAIEREESRGAHRRLDFPDRDDQRWVRRIHRSIEDFA